MMSGFNTPGDTSATSTPKMMSSRLAGMKFMQRAGTFSKPTTPASEPASKRIRTDTGYTPASSATTTPASERRSYFPTSIQAQASPVQSYHPDGSTETQWVIASSAPFDIPVSNGSVVAEEASEDEASGRQTYGNYKRKNRAETTTTTLSSSTSRGAAHSMRPLSDDDDEEGSDMSMDSNEDEDEDSEEEDEHARSRAVARKQKAAVMTGHDLDRIDLRKSQYTKSKGTLNPLRTGGKRPYTGPLANQGKNKPGRDKHRNRGKNKPKPKLNKKGGK